MWYSVQVIVFNEMNRILGLCIMVLLFFDNANYDKWVSKFYIEISCGFAVVNGLTEAYR